MISSFSMRRWRARIFFGVFINEYTSFTVDMTVSETYASVASSFSRSTEWPISGLYRMPRGKFE